MLAALRGALGDVPESEDADAPIERNYNQDRVLADPVARLRRRLEDSGADVTLCQPDDVPRAVAAAIRQAGSEPAVCSKELPAQWRCTDPPLHEDDGQWDAAALARFGVGVTGAAVAIAETGTLGLDAQGVSGRRLLSLIPDRHVCIVRSSDVVADVPQALAQLDPRRPLTFITGPSATVDIELVRTQGVHGPRALHVVLVGDAPSSPAPAG